MANLPIILSTLLIISSLVLFTHGLNKNSNSPNLLSIILLIVSIALFIASYTDRIADALWVILFISISFALMILPCWMIKNNIRYYELTFILTHLLAFILISGIRSLILIENPFYYTNILMWFSIIYMFKRNKVFIRAGLIIAFLLTIRFFFPVGLEIPFELHTNSENNFITIDSKPVRLAKEYYQENYPGHIIDSIVSINDRDKTIIVITNTKVKKNHKTIHNERKVHRLIYSDNNIIE